MKIFVQTFDNFLFSKRYVRSVLTGIVLLILFNCGSGMAVLREKMNQNSKILVHMIVPTTMDIERAGKMGYSQGPQQQSKITAAGILKLREKFADALKKEFPNVKIVTTATVEIPTKKDTFMGMPVEGPDYSKLDYDTVLTLVLRQAVKENGTVGSASFAGAAYGPPYGYDYTATVGISGTDPKTNKPISFGMDSVIARHQASLGKDLQEQKLDPQLVSASPDTAGLWQALEKDSVERIAAFIAELKKK